MEFKDKIKALGERIKKTKDRVTTEEATKNAFIMPIIKELGYDIFNPMEVVPEFVCDVGIKKGEKIDYAIMKDNAPILLIECKWHGANLDVKKESQLIRYFQAAKVKFAILTNGIEYKFYTDLEKENIMDVKPFFSFDITQIKDNQISELKKFHKDEFDFENIVNSASDLKYVNELKKYISLNIEEPSEEFVRFFTKQVYDGIVNKKVLEQFTELVKKSFLQQISDSVTRRLEGALKKENELQKESDIEPEKDSKIITTEEEMDAFYIVRAICCAKIKQDKIAHRDTQSYFGILFDDNNRKTICRLFLTERRKQIVIFDENKNEMKYELESIEDIHKYSNELLKIVEFYINN